MNAKDNLDKASRFEADWYDLAALRRRVPEINSRARRMGAKGQITADDLGDKLADAGGRCSCGKDFGPRFADKWTICFRVPLSRGGECSRANIDLICRACEMSRAAKLGVKWEGSGRARAASKARRGSLPPGPVKSPGTVPLVFRDEEEEDS